jgi:hypothetical protein
MRSANAIYFFVLLFLGIVLFSFRAEAAKAVTEDWKYVASSKEGDRLFYDSSSVIPVSGNAVQVWVKKLGHDGSAVKILEEINCSFSIIRERQVVIERQGKTPLSSKPRSNWQAMELDPVMKELHRILCN